MSDFRPWSFPNGLHLPPQALARNTSSEVSIRSRWRLHQIESPQGVFASLGWYALGCASVPIFVANTAPNYPQVAVASTESAHCCLLLPPLLLCAYPTSCQGEPQDFPASENKTLLSSALLFFLSSLPPPSTSIHPSAAHPTFVSITTATPHPNHSTTSPFRHHASVHRPRCPGRHGSGCPSHQASLVSSSFTCSL